MHRGVVLLTSSDLEQAEEGDVTLAVASIFSHFPKVACHLHTVDCGPFTRSQLAWMQLTLRPYVVNICSRYPYNLGGTTPS